MKLIKIKIKYYRDEMNKNKHSDACNYLAPYKLDVLKIVEYRFSCEMEAHVEVTISKRHFNVCILMSIIIIFFSFYVKIPHSWENDFRGKSPVDSADTPRVKNFVEIIISLPFQDKHIFCVLCRNEKWQPNDFWEKSPVDSADTVCVKNSVEIALHHSVSEINPYS